MTAAIIGWESESPVPNGHRFNDYLNARDGRLYMEKLDLSGLFHEPSDIQTGTALQHNVFRPFFYADTACFSCQSVSHVFPVQSKHARLFIVADKQTAERLNPWTRKPETNF